MRGPMPEVEWTRLARLKGIASLDDVAQMQLRRATDDRNRGSDFARGNTGGVAGDLRKERGISQQRDLDRLAKARAKHRVRKRLKQQLIAQYRKRHRERADEILLAKAIDAVLHAHRSVILREHGRGQAHESHAAVRDGRAVSHRIKHSTATDGNDEALATDAVLSDEFYDKVTDARVMLGRLATRHGDDRGQFRHS